MDNKLQATSYYQFQIKSASFSVPYYLNFQILGGFDKLYHDGNGTTTEFKDLLILFNGTPFGFDGGELSPDFFFEDDEPDLTNEDLIQMDIFKQHWSLLWDLYQLPKINNLNLSETLTFDAYRLTDYVFHPTVYFLQKQKEIFEKFNFTFVKLPNNYLYEDFVLSGSRITTQNQEYVQGIHLNKVDTSSFPAVLMDVALETKNISDELPTLNFVFAESDTFDYIHQYSARLPQWFSANAAIFASLNESSYANKKLAFYWFGKAPQTESFSENFILNDENLNYYLLNTSGIGLDPKDKRLFLPASGGIPSQQLKSTMVDGELISENIFKGFTCLIPYSFVIDYSKQLLKPEPLTLLHTDSTPFVSSPFTAVEILNLGLVTNISDSHLKTPEYPVNITNADTLTHLWDINKQSVFSNAVNFDGALFSGTGIPEISISPFQERSEIYKAEFGENGVTNTKKIITANSSDVPSLFTIKIPFVRNSEIIKNSEEEYDETKKQTLNNFRLFIYDDDDNIFFISEEISANIEINPNSIFEMTAFFRFFSVMGETIEDITII